MEEALDSLRTTRRRIFSSRWRLGSKSISKKASKTRPPLLELPLEIRLEIYSYLNPSASFTQPLASPLYQLLFICKFLRHELASLFYRTPTFTFPFPDPRPCGFFLATTASHLHLLTGLTLSVCGNETYTLEPIFALLVEKQVPLKTLVLKLVLVLGETMPEKPPPEKMLPESLGKTTLLEARSCARRLDESFGEPLSEAVVGSSLSPFNDETSKSALGRLKTVRYLAVDGHPTGDWATEFEIGVLELHSRMFELAKEEGKRVYKGPSPLPPGYTYESYWLHNDVWIQGEEKPDPADFLRENYGPWRRPLTFQP